MPPMISHGGHFYISPPKHMNQQELFHTANLKAACALLTLGFKKETWTRTVRADGQESTIYWFASRNAEGLSAEAVHDGMTKGGDSLAMTDPENVINYLRAFAANRDELIKDIRSTPKLVVIEANGRTFALPENASDETKRKFAAIL